MALFPVQGVVEGDFVVVLVPVDDTDPMRVVAEKIAYHGIGKRVRSKNRPKCLKIPLRRCGGRRGKPCKKS